VANVVPKKPTRKRTGTIQEFERPDGSKFFRARIRLADGSRPWVDVPPAYSEPRAREYAAMLQEKEDLHGGFLAAKTGPVAVVESVATWFDRWHTSRTAAGLRSVATDRARVRDYVLPLLRSPSMAKVTRDEIEDVRDALDAKIQAGAMSWKTAANTWGLVTKAFEDAVNSKRRELRARTDNPARGIAAPERGERKAKVYLYPSEALALLACEDVPLRWRRFFALSIYLYARPGEVRALQWEDVDLERGVVHIHRSVDRETGLDKSTKTDTSRRVPIELALRPLLAAMHAECEGTGRLLPWGSKDRKLSRQIQRCMRLAGLTRADLYASDRARKPMTFYDLRATGITWCAVRGDDPLRIKQRAGHRIFSTTEIYIREAENLGAADFGTPFPPLPESLLRSTERSTESHAENVAPQKQTGPRCLPQSCPVEAPGIEPGSENRAPGASTCVARLLNRPELRRRTGSHQGYPPV